MTVQVFYDEIFRFQSRQEKWLPGASFYFDEKKFPGANETSRGHIVTIYDTSVFSLTML